MEGESPKYSVEQERLPNLDRICQAAASLFSSSFHRTVLYCTVSYRIVKYPSVSF